jgi:carboxymethylenebutenolidase
MSERTSTSVPVAAGELPVVRQGPADAGAVPALLVIPSIFGPADDLLDRLAELGDDALVVVPDPFWRTGEGAVPYDDVDTAFGRLAEFDMAACAAEMAAAAEWARAQGNGTVIGLGICFGGPFVLRLAAKGHLDGVVTWHGSRMEQSLDVVPDISCPVRHHLGGVDPVTPPETIEAIRDAFADHDDAQVVVHADATHGFSHAGDAFDPAAYRAGFESVRDLLLG